MPLFYFILKDGRNSIPDCDGVELADLQAARSEAIGVAYELMRNRERHTRSWRLQVCDSYLQPRFELLFASIDNTIAHLPEKTRNIIESVSRNFAALHETIAAVTNTAEQTKDILAKARRPSRE